MKIYTKTHLYLATKPLVNSIKALNSLEKKDTLVAIRLDISDELLQFATNNSSFRVPVSRISQESEYEEGVDVSPPTVFLRLEELASIAKAKNTKATASDLIELVLDSDGNLFEQKFPNGLAVNSRLEQPGSEAISPPVIEGDDGYFVIDSIRTAQLIKVLSDQKDLNYIEIDWTNILAVGDTQVSLITLAIEDINDEKQAPKRVQINPTAAQIKYLKALINSEFFDEFYVSETNPLLWSNEENENDVKFVIKWQPFPATLASFHFENWEMLQDDFLVSPIDCFYINSTKAFKELVKNSISSLSNKNSLCTLVYRESNELDSDIASIQLNFYQDKDAKSTVDYEYILEARNGQLDLFRDDDSADIDELDPNELEFALSTQQLLSILSLATDKLEIWLANNKIKAVTDTGLQTIVIPLMVIWED